MELPTTVFYAFLSKEYLGSFLLLAIMNIIGVNSLFQVLIWTQGFYFIWVNAWERDHFKGKHQHVSSALYCFVLPPVMCESSTGEWVGRMLLVPIQIDSQVGTVPQVSGIGILSGHAIASAVGDLGPGCSLAPCPGLKVHTSNSIPPSTVGCHHCSMVIFAVPPTRLRFLFPRKNGRDNLGESLGLPRFPSPSQDHDWHIHGTLSRANGHLGGPQTDSSCVCGSWMFYTLTPSLHQFLNFFTEFFFPCL